MLYVQLFQHNRQDYLKQYQRSHLLAHENISLSSNQYNEKFPNISQQATPNVDYQRNPTLFFLSRIPSLDMKSTTEHQQKTGNKDSMTTLHRSSITDYNKKVSNEHSEKFSTFARHQAYSNVYRLAQSTTIGNHLISNSIHTEFDRPTTAPLIFETTIHRPVSEKIKTAMLSRSPTPLRNARLVDSSDNYDNTRNVLYYQLKSPVFKSDNHFIQQSSHTNTSIPINETINTNSYNSFIDLPVDTNSNGITTVNYDDEPQILYRNTQHKVNNMILNHLISNSIHTEFDRPTTAPLIFETTIHRPVSEKIKTAMLSRSPTPLRNARLVDSSDNYDNTRHALYYQLKSPVFKSDNHFIQQSSHINTSIPMNETINTNSYNSFIDLPVDTNSHGITTVNYDDEPQILYRNTQHKMSGFQHIANLGSWQRNSKNRQIESLEKSKEIEREYEISKNIDQSSLNSSSSSTTTTYEYKSPFSEEYDQAISLHTHYQTNNNINEWHLRDFYRDVKTQFEPDTNTKVVFEKCLKLARLQANTIKWEQRRRQNLIIYNRLLKNGTFDNNNNNNEKEIRDINELKRELRCNECKRLACLGNCAPGNEYHQYKRFPPFSSLSNTRDQNRSRLNLRTQRSTMDLRPCTTQQTTRETKFKFEQTNTNPVVIVPVFENESQTKRSQKKLTHRYLPNKSLRSQRRETLTAITTPKISS
ncbi:unnamed protein product [Rotaria sp. Silwood1]|nr:unnamed protein product [Rotaria sp. Silwood1]